MRIGALSLGRALDGERLVFITAKLALA